MGTLPVGLQVTQDGEALLQVLQTARPDWPAMEDVEGPAIICRVDTDVRLIWTGQEHAPGPLRVDFVEGALAHRQRVRGKERLLDAVRPKKGRAPESVVDATGGLGRDAWMLAASGLSVTVLERHPLIALLLADGLYRACQHPDAAMIARRIRLVCADSVDWLDTTAVSADVVYLDPMFPPRDKAAAVKRDMQYFHVLLGSGSDNEPALLEAACRHARQRVVVKRPRHAPPLAGRPAHHQIEGKRSRFDVYRPEDD